MFWKFEFHYIRERAGLKVSMEGPTFIIPVSRDTQDTISIYAGNMDRYCNYKSLNGQWGSVKLRNWK